MCQVGMWHWDQSISALWFGKKVFFSQDVLFDELRSGIDDDSQPQKSESGTKVIQLDCLSEDEAVEEGLQGKEKHQIFMETGSQ